MLGTASVLGLGIGTADGNGGAGLSLDSVEELRAVVRHELQAGGAGAEPLKTLARFGVSSVDDPSGDLYAEALLAAGRLGELREAARNLELAPVDRIRSAVLATAAAVSEGAGILWEAAAFWEAAALFSGDGTEDGAYAAIAARVGRLRVERKRSRRSNSEPDAAERLLRGARISDLMSAVNAAPRRLSEKRVLCRELVAELREALVDPEFSSARIVRDLLTDLMESGEAFPSAMVDRDRRILLSKALLGRQSGRASLRDLGAITAKLLTGGGIDLPLLSNILREEVDWTLARAVPQKGFF
jgi:hypothetical protein